MPCGFVGDATNPAASDDINKKSLKQRDGVFSHGWHMVC
jgi:hypothetical protein